jgi:hypothetical protein
LIYDVSATFKVSETWPMLLKRDPSVFYAQQP